MLRRGSRWDSPEKVGRTYTFVCQHPLPFSSAWDKLLPYTRVSEHRKSDRLRVNCPVEVTEKGVAAAVRCNLADISAGGCYVETVLPFPVSAELEISFSPQGFPVKARGTVQYVHPGMGMGLKFAWKDEEPFNRLLAALEKQQPATEEAAFS